MKNKLLLIILLVQIVFISCSNENKKDLNVKLIGIVNGDYTIDTELYNEENKTVFPWSDTSKVNSIQNIITHSVDTFEINDTSIIRSVKNYVNGEVVCCVIDTSKYYIEDINKRKQLFINVGNSILILSLENDEDLKKRVRKEINIPTWNIKLTEILDEKNFKDSLHTTKEYFTNKPISYEQFSIYLGNRDLKLNTLKFPKRNDRIISQISKDISEFEVENLIKYITTTYPEIKYRDEFHEDRREITMLYDGFYILITENRTSDGGKYDKYDLNKYILYYSDYYTLSKLLLNRIGEEYQIVSNTEIKLPK
jgi:hypothetical protein